MGLRSEHTPVMQHSSLLSSGTMVRQGMMEQAFRFAWRIPRDIRYPLVQLTRFGIDRVCRSWSLVLSTFGTNLFVNPGIVRCRRPQLRGIGSLLVSQTVSVFADVGLRDTSGQHLLRH